ncbi:hypothetical protein [Paenibacillus lemnae]|uniref:Lipoprotein n=1 Tax=Paenibacillus lemnae TaxID=1330551 RepID=A0A848M4L6_PAELE|nr:hypothetical protein [Paenibacillus lemnae]NMO94743.1 hypothetical protein [Paenibacillus lemnae]
MKYIKVLLILFVSFLFSLLVACGADDIKHEKSEHWDVSLQRSTGSFSIFYNGDETQIKDLVYEITGTNIDQQGKASAEQEIPFNLSGTVTDSDKTKDPIEFKISWNNKIETVTFE